MKLTYKDLEPLICEKLSKGADVVIQPRGTSMLPLIHQGKDEVVLCKNIGRLKKYDIPFYKRESGQFVLHRIVKVRKNDYVLCGDNQWNREYGITDDMIIGVVKEIRQSGKVIKVSDKDYLKYAKKQVAKQRCRYYYISIKKIVKKILRIKNEHE